MKFCPDCENALTDIRDDAESGGVGFRCRKCTYTETINHSNPLVYEHNLREDMSARIVANPYLSKDPTLPRYVMKCTKEGCPSEEVVGVKVDTKNIVWMYQCTTCNTSWKQASRRG